MFDHIAMAKFTKEMKSAKRTFEKAIVDSRGQLPYKAKCEVTGKLTDKPQFSRSAAPARPRSKSPKSAKGGSSDKKKTACPAEVKQRNSCKYGKDCHYSHDKDVIARARKAKPRSRSPSSRPKAKGKAKAKTRGRRATPVVAGEEDEDNDGEEADEEDGDNEEEEDPGDEEEDAPELVESEDDDEEGGEVAGDSEIEDLSDGEAQCPSDT